MNADYERSSKSNISSYPKSNPELKSQGRQDFPLGRKRPFLVLDLVLSMMFLFIYTNLVNVVLIYGTF